MTVVNIIGGLLFGSIGLIALIYGKKLANVKTMLLGALLIVYPYFVSNTILVYSIGIAVTVALFIFK